MWARSESTYGGARAQRFGVPPYLQAPGLKPALGGLEALDIRFDGGPVTAFKVAEDGNRLILRLWNLLDQRVPGSVTLLQGWGLAEMCDALERPEKPLTVAEGRVVFTAPAKSIVTVALRRAPR